MLYDVLQNPHLIYNILSNDYHQPLPLHSTFIETSCFPNDTPLHSKIVWIYVAYASLNEQERHPGWKETPTRRENGGLARSIHFSSHTPGHRSSGHVRKVIGTYPSENDFVTRHRLGCWLGVDDVGEDGTPVGVL